MSTSDFDRQFAPLLRPATPEHPLRVVTMEEQRIAADLAYNRLKNSGEMLRRDIDRAHHQEINSGEHA